MTGLQHGDAVRWNVVGKADVELQAEGCGDLVGEVPADGSLERVHPPHQLALVPAEREPVIAVPVAGDPCRTLGRDRRSDAVRIAKRGEVERGVDGAQSGLVREHLAHGDALLALGGELGPVLGQRGVVVEQPPGVRKRHGDRRHPLGRREHVDEGVLLPRERGCGVAHASPEVDHEFTGNDHRACGADLAALVDVACERLGHGLVARTCEPLDLGHGTSLRWGVSHSRGSLGRD